ncbi:hypothetical protein E4U21_000293 [Claviceps maximensis]|nr:hypothetical protein E4U21_000293 [Claviceps maximensis]
MPLMSRLRVDTRAALSVNTGVHEYASSVSSQEYDDASDFGDDYHDREPVVVTSPTGLQYNLEQLSDPTRAAVREAFDEPPTMTMQLCSRIGETYVFQVTEVVNRAVRIEAPSPCHRGGERGRDEDGNMHQAGGFSKITCSCSGEEDGVPCKHRLLVLDLFANATRHHDDNSKPLKMTDGGYAEEMGNPFQAICDFHLDILADGLHCRVADRYSHSRDEPDDDRSANVKELLASVCSKLSEDLCQEISGHLPLEEDILMETNLLLSLARSADPINDLCRSLSRRADLVLCELDTFLCSTSPDRPSSPTSSIYPESCPNVAWATTHFSRIADQIGFSIRTRDRPWKPSECRSAVQTLVHILASVTAPADFCGLVTGRTSLYSNLIGNRTEADFVIQELELLPEAASYFVDRLTSIAQRIAILGAPNAYMKKFNNLLRNLRNMRTSSADTSTGTKRPSPSEDADWKPFKRMK